MNTLLIFQFETGDSSVRYYEVPIVITSGCNWDKLREVENSIDSFVRNVHGDCDYEDMVEAVMNKSGLIYEFIQSDIPQCQMLRTIQI